VVERFLAKEEVASSNLVFRLCRSGGSGRRDSLKNCWRAISVSVRVRPSAPRAIEAETGTGSAELCSGSTGDFGSSSPGSNPGSAAITPAQSLNKHHSPAAYLPCHYRGRLRPSLSGSGGGRLRDGRGKEGCKGKTKVD
jgi:hypothetical protein